MKPNYERIKTWIKYFKSVPERNISFVYNYTEELEEKRPVNLGTVANVLGWVHFIPRLGEKLLRQGAFSVDKLMGLEKGYCHALLWTGDPTMSSLELKRIWVKELKKLIPWYHRIQTYL